MIDLEDDITEEDLNDESSWKKFHEDIKKAKEKFIASGKIGGNPWGYPLNMQKDEIYLRNNKSNEQHPLEQHNDI